jgi:hypothetical protein
VASAEVEPPPRFVGTEVAADEILEVISSASSRSFKPVGHSSVVLRMRTVARVTAALRVRSHDLERGYQYEIAAYRISRLLGLDNVPPAVYRRATWNEIRQRFHEDMLDRRGSVRRAVLWDDDGSAPGAAVYWVKGLRSVGLEKKARWQSWNLPTDSSQQRAFLRDNDRSFSTPLLERRYENLLGGLTRTERFSKDTIHHLAALDEASIRAELARDPSHETDPLLNAAQIADVLDRRATILSYIAALIEERGEDDVLFFP